FHGKDCHAMALQPGNTRTPRSRSRSSIADRPASPRQPGARRRVLLCVRKRENFDLPKREREANMTQRLTGKVAIVTGGASGFGRATALRFAAEGARVVVVDLDEAGGQEVVEEIGCGGGQAALFVGDVGEKTTADGFVAEAVNRYGALHVLVNNAGIA